MLRFSNIGFLTLLGSILLFLFQSIVSLINRNQEWQDYRIVDILEPEDYEWVNDIVLFNFDTLSNYVLNMQLFMVLFCLTVIFFIMSGIFEK